MKLAITYLIGLTFGLGISISGMANPAKVLNFFDVAGTWDPSLVVVMLGAVIVTAIGYRIIFRSRTKPVLTAHFNVPTSRVIDARLVGGSALFGLGWGIAGFCPGGALPAIGTAQPSVLIFFVAFVAGVIVAKTMIQTLNRRAAAVAAE